MLHQQNEHLLQAVDPNEWSFEKIQSYYAKFSKTYDEHLKSTYQAPDVISGFILTELIPKSVLDLGCGTGKRYLLRYRSILLGDE